MINDMIMMMIGSQKRHDLYQVCETGAGRVNSSYKLESKKVAENIDYDDDHYH